MIDFEVNMNSGDVFDFMLKSTYNGFSGLLGSLVGALMIVAGIYVENYFLIAAGGVFLCYLPGMLYWKSRQQMLQNPELMETFHYILDDAGIYVSQKEQTTLQKWENVVKVVSTGRSLIVYVTDKNAFIFPKRELGDYTSRVIQVISTHLPAQKVKIRA